MFTPRTSSSRQPGCRIDGAAGHRLPAWSSPASPVSPFPSQAAGSLRTGKRHRSIGSRLIGQTFSDPKYFWGRPSATAPQPYNGVASTGSNLGRLNPALLDQVKANAKSLRDADPATCSQFRSTS